MIDYCYGSVYKVTLSCKRINVMNCKRKEKGLISVTQESANAGLPPLCRRDDVLDLRGVGSVGRPECGWARAVKSHGEVEAVLKATFLTHFLSLFVIGLFLRLP